MKPFDMTALILLLKYVDPVSAFKEKCKYP